MPFLDLSPVSSRPVSGDESAKLLILGHCPDGYALRDHVPFAGPTEGVLTHAMHQAKLLKSQVCFTNLIYDDKDYNKYWRDKGHKGPSQLKAPIKNYQESIMEFVDAHNFTHILTLGELTMYALTGQSRIVERRGYPVKAKNRDIWIIPAQHPKDMIRMNYIWRYYLAHDMTKAKRAVEDPSILEKELDITICTTVEEVWAAMAYYKASGKTVFYDIEVSNFHTSCIGFSDSIATAHVIPVDDRWTVEEEIQIWIAMASVLEDPAIVKGAQNGIFDAHFLLHDMGIFVTGYAPDEVKQVDTMMAHSILYPDFLKSLGFLASIYTDYPYWKDELHDKSIKKEN